MGKNPAATDDYWEERRKAVEQLAADLYTDELVTRLSHMLEPFASDQARLEFPVKIRQWAADWLLFRQIEGRYIEPGLLATRSEKLKRLIDVTQRLRATYYEVWAAYNEIDELDRLALWDDMEQRKSLAGAQPGPLDSENVFFDVWDWLGDIHASATRITERLPRKRGRPPRGRLDNPFMRELKNIYFEATGKRPTIATNGGKIYGRFKDFAKEAMYPVRRDVTDSVVANLFYK